MSDDGVSAGEQAAFTAAHTLIKKLISDTRFSGHDIGKGVLTEEVAGLFYEVADDFACREKGR